MGTVEWQRVVDLTQIMDRRNGKDRLAELIELARQEQKMLTVVFYDINGLHLINDTYGHHEGDNLLLYVSKTNNLCITRHGAVPLRIKK